MSRAGIQKSAKIPGAEMSARHRLRVTHGDGTTRRSGPSIRVRRTYPKRYGAIPRQGREAGA